MNVKVRTTQLDNIEVLFYLRKESAFRFKIKLGAAVAEWLSSRLA